VHRSVQAIKAAGCQAGLVFNPAAPLDVLDWVIDEIDLILVMSVNPGFGGQASSIAPCARWKRRASASRQRARHPPGGGRRHQARQHPPVADAGADTFVAGSAIFGKPDYAAVIGQMRRALQG
jgi:ribulose-phosphate 3-epimerase